MEVVDLEGEEKRCHEELNLLRLQHFFLAVSNKIKMKLIQWETAAAVRETKNSK